jgi:type IV pilus assembly protein PilM
MAARPLGVWGIDLGQCALKAIRLEDKDGQVVATAFEYIEHPKILSQPDADPDELTREALSQFLSRNKIKGDLVCISVPGQSGLARFVKLPPVDEKKIADIVKFEAKQQIPFPLEEVVWDFQRLNKGDIVDGLALETEIGLFAMKRDMVTRAIKQFKDVGVEVHVVQMAPLALCNFIAYDLLGKGTDNPEDEGNASECVVALEIGTDNSNLVITDGGRIIWQRPIPIGGNHFTRALTKEMKLTFAKAEHLKRNAAKSPELRKILSALKQVLNDFVGEVQRSLGYFTNTHRNAKIKYMVGLGNAFRLPGLQKFLQEKLQLEVRKLQKLERATGETVTAAPTFADNIMSFGVAYGEALQGLKKARLQTNLLPYEVRLERLVRGKKPWAVAAAVVLGFGMFLMALAAGAEKSAVESENVKNAKKAALDAATEAKKWKTEADAEQKKIDDATKDLDRLSAGVKERMNWQLLHQFVNMVTPQANGGHLAEKSETHVEVKKKYWAGYPEAEQARDPEKARDTKKALEAQKAFKYFEDKKYNANLKLTLDEAQKRDQIIKEHLIQLNILGVNALYADDLGPYFKAISKESTDILPGLNDEEKGKIAKLLKGSDKDTPKSGWVVEIRGYTYHWDTEKFIENTLIQNLRNPSQLNDITIDEDLKKKVSNRVSFLHNYKVVTVRKPLPGKFTVIENSQLPWLLAGGAAAAPASAPAVPAAPWAPLGEAAATWFEPATDQPLVEGKETLNRTEFVVLFLWDEQIAQLGAAPATDKK